MTTIRRSAAAACFTLALVQSAAAGTACAIVSKTDVSRAFGTAFADGEGVVTSKAGPGKAQVSQCSFAALVRSETAAHRVSVMVRIAPIADPQVYARVHQALLTSAQAHPQEISGIGDQALWVPQGAAPHSPEQLNVFKSGTIYLIVSVSAGSRAPSMLAPATTLAKVALSRLGK